MSKLKSAALAVLTVAAFALLAGPAAARDRNHDRIPDRWEKRHHLSLHVNQARRDQDRDGLRNRAEFKAGMDPRDDDSDNDGTEDSDEHAGTIGSFDAATGKLTIKLFGGDSITGIVGDGTEIECDDSAKAADHGDDDEGDDHGDDDQGDDHGDDDHGDDDHGDDDQGDDHGDDEGDDHGDDDESSCGTEALTTGREVKEADLRLASGKATFKKIELD